MRLLWQVCLCCLLAGDIAMAQRGGGGMRGGGGYVGGMPGGTRGGNFGGLTGGANFHGGFGPIRGAFAGFPNALGFPANGFGLASTNVSFPLGLGFPANPLGFPNGLGFPNFNNIFFFRGFPSFNNGFSFNRGFNSGSFGGLGGWGFGIEGIGTLPDSSYWPRYDYSPYNLQYAPYQPSPNIAWAYSPEPTVQPLSAERARPVMHEYDQSGREIFSAGSPSPNLPAVPPLPVERDRGVIHEYDQSGREIPR